MKAGENDFNLISTDVRVAAGQSASALAETMACLLKSAVAIMRSDGDGLSQEVWGALYLIETAVAINDALRGEGATS